MAMYQNTLSRHARPKAPIKDLALIKHIASLVSYEAETGLFTWRTDRKPDIKAGDPAGALRNGYLVITVDGHGYYAHHLVFAFLNGRWPEPYTVRLRAKASRRAIKPEDLDVDYAYLYDSLKVDTRRKNRLKAARYRAEQRARREAIEAEASLLDGVHRTTDGTFKVLVRTPSNAHRVIAENVPTKAKAERIALDYRRRRAFVDAFTPPEPRNEQERAQWRALRAASGDLTYDYVRQTFAHDQKTGELLWLHPEPRRGIRADQPHGRHMAVDHLGRKFPAHLLVWFLAHKVWPKRGQIRWRNGDQTDNRIDNLYLKDTP